MPDRSQPSVPEELFPEARDLIELAEHHLAALRGADLRGLAAAEHLDEVSRAVHTLKGLSGMFGLSAIEGIAHALEDLLEEFRTGAAVEEAAFGGTMTALRRGLNEAQVARAGEGFERLGSEVQRLSRALSKEVRLVMTAASTSLDRRSADQLGPLLVHLIRNAIDHGIEAPEQRMAIGKSAEGTIVIGARRSGSYVVLEVEDDGAGVDVGAVREAAKARGLLDAATAGAMPERELWAMLFRSGFSTRDSVTSTSGRGVGLDAVRAAVERLGGVVDLGSEPGRFTRVCITLPAAPESGMVPSPGVHQGDRW